VLKNHKEGDVMKKRSGYVGILLVLSCVLMLAVVGCAGSGGGWLNYSSYYFRASNRVSLNPTHTDYGFRCAQ
jgi:hypothetical protein